MFFTGNKEAEQTLEINIDTTEPVFNVNLDTSTLWACSSLLFNVPSFAEAVTTTS
jgi:hypothetical protein